jgi:2-iminobutanoate/2-iminopropanoate deaminase
MTRDAITTPDAARPRGPYSQAVRAGGLVFVAGQLPLDADGGLVGEGDIAAQTGAVLANMAAILAAAGSSLDRVVKTTVFLTSLDDFAGMNEVYGRRLRGSLSGALDRRDRPPATGMLLEIECVALA